MKTIDRYLGSMLGLAIGDALGATVEFKKRGTFEPVKDLIGGGPFDLMPGEWTDDTSMALCLADSLLTCRGFNPKDQMERYLRWYRNGYMSSKDYCFDIGNTTKEALVLYEKTGNPYCGSFEPRSAGNGSIMRLAPVPLYFARDLQLGIDFSAKSSRTTHSVLIAVDACRYFGALIILAVNGTSKEDMFSDAVLNHFTWSDCSLEPEIFEIAGGSFKIKKEDDILTSGFVVHTLEAALWAFYKSSSFEEGLLLAVNLGDDADTTGAVYGQFAGAYYGVNSLPDRMLKKIVNREKIEEISVQLYKNRY